MNQEQNGQGTVDEKIPPVNHVGQDAVRTSTSVLQSTGATEQDHNAFLNKAVHTGASEESSGSSPSSTTTTTIRDLEKALWQTDATKDQRQEENSLSPHNGHTMNADAIPTPNSTVNAAPADDGHDYPEGGLQAWLVVLGSFAGMTAGFGLMNTVGVFQAYLSTHQLADEPPSVVGWIFSIYIFLAFFCGVQIGPIFDAKGPRWLVLAGSVALVGGTLAFGEATELWQFILTFSILCGLGTSLIFTPAVSAIAHWFYRRRAFATGLATTGGSFGGVVFPLMLQRLFPLVGFAWAVRVLALIFLGLCIIANILIRSRLPPPDPAPTVKDMLPDWRIFRNNWVFILTTAGVFFIEWALFVPLAYISSFALARNIDPTFAYQILAIINGGSFFGRWAPGLVADKVGRFNTMIVTVALCVLAVVAFWLPTNFIPTTAATHQNQITPLIVVFALLFGFASGSNISLTPVCVGQLCDTEVFGRWYAGLYTIVSFGCLTGLPIAGALLKADGGNYTGLILFTLASYVGGLVCFVWARVLVVGWSVQKIY